MIKEWLQAIGIIVAIVMILTILILILLTRICMG